MTAHETRREIPEQEAARRSAPELRAAPIVTSGGTASVQLTLAISDYEHVREITQGIVRADGITLTPLIFPSIEEITFRFTRNLEWDVSELSFGKYISLTSQGAAPMVAIPVFPSRVHRHSAIYVRGDRGIKTAKDLEGRAVGIPEWAQTAGIYVRGVLAEDYGVDLAKIRWLQAGVDQAGPRREGRAQAAGRHPLRGAAANQPHRHARQRRDRRGDLGPRTGGVLGGRRQGGAAVSRTIAPRRSGCSRRPASSRSCM